MEKQNFKRFLKGEEVSNKRLGNDCVIYTRVSDRKQVKNASLDTQLQDCLELAVNKGLNVVATFGGDFESAKQDERKEFQRMLGYVKKRKSVAYIIVWAFDRFSRSGAGGISINADLLSNYGVVTISASQQIADPSSAEGQLQQNIYQIFAHYDNQLRAKRAVRGTRAKLEKGLYIGRGVRGLKNLHPKDVAENHKWVKTEEAKYIKQAFEMSATGLSNVEVAKLLAKKGFEIEPKRLTEVLRNPLYCGMIVNRLLPDGVKEATNIPKIVSKRLFLKVNKPEVAERQGYSNKLDRDELPLRRFICCSYCGNAYTGYIKKKKLKTRELTFFYYKCNTKGCGRNTNAKNVHGSFKEVLRNFLLPSDKGVVGLIRHQMVQVFQRINGESDANELRLKTEIEKINQQLEQAEKRHFLGEMKPEIFDKFYNELLKKKSELEETLKNNSTYLSNLENSVSFLTEVFTKPASYWETMRIEKKKRFQKMLFPEGITYDLNNDIYRTKRINVLVQCMLREIRVWGKIKNGFKLHIEQESVLVGDTGFEPVTPCL